MEWLWLRPDLSVGKRLCIYLAVTLSLWCGLGSWSYGEDVILATVAAAGGNQVKYKELFPLLVLGFICSKHHLFTAMFASINITTSHPLRMLVLLANGSKYRSV